MEERIGVSGWRYKPWEGEFYPENLPKSDQLKFISQNMNTVEINGTFYALQRPKNFKKWKEQSCEDFKFSIKGSRYITHVRRLRDVEKALANFFASGVLELKDKLGPFLWQFPPNFKFDFDLFREFIKLLPSSTSELGRLARKHDDKTKGRARLAPWKDSPVRHAIEVRNDSFNNEDFFELLEKKNIALVISDAGDNWPMYERMTADFVYIRLHGKEKLYKSGYTYQAISAWKKKIKKWEKEGRDVFVYFDNDVKTHAPFNAMYLKESLSGKNTTDFGHSELLQHNPH